MPQFTLPFRGVITPACLQAGKCYLLGFRWEDIVNVGSNYSYVTSCKYSFECSHQEKWYLGSQEELGIPAALLCSFPSLPIAVMPLRVKLGKGNLIVN